jgi:hypothetical protein
MLQIDDHPSKLEKTAFFGLLEEKRVGNGYCSTPVL